MPNRLAEETSPYLLQHADNPVEWYPWGEEAFARAREKDRPVLLSVGYSACHWCHVMAHESFEDAETARLMNELFVNVKVDREERPDVDSLYMAAVQQMTRHGGWPMTVFLTPEGVPFYGGTYYPPTPRHGMPSFPQVLRGVSDAYRDRRAQVEATATELREVLRQSTTLRPPPSPLDEDLLRRAHDRIVARYDPEHGGFGDAPKFPQPMLLEFLLRAWKRGGDPDTLAMVEHTLEAMWRGGMYDHLGGGFHRYSVDARWVVPHFEKMLYDNALLPQAYLHAYQATGEDRYRRVAEEVLDWAMREMRSPEGAFYSSQDADTEGEEGLFYVWTAEEIDAALGPDDGPLVRLYHGVTPEGNFEGRNILHAPEEVDAAAARAGVAPERMREALDRGRKSLYRVRGERERPGRDEKVLTAWNAMMAQAFAEAAWVLDRDDYREVAVDALTFLLARLRPAGRLLRTYKDGRARIDAFLEDHALLVDALLSLYRATFDPVRVEEARSVADALLEGFWEEEEGSFYDTAADADPLIVRPRDFFDNATPSGSSAAVLALLRLAEITGDDRYRAPAVRVLEGTSALIDRMPQGFGHLLVALDEHLAPPREVALVGDPGAPGTAALLDELRGRFLPGTLIALRDPARPDGEAAGIPLLAGRDLVDGKPAAYVCESFACRRPVTTPDALAAELG